MSPRLRPLTRMTPMRERNVAESVYILGAGMTRFGRYPETPLEQIGAEAARMALSEAHLFQKRTPH